MRHLRSTATSSSAADICRRSRRHRIRRDRHPQPRRRQQPHRHARPRRSSSAISTCSPAGRSSINAVAEATAKRGPTACCACPTAVSESCSTHVPRVGGEVDRSRFQVRREKPDRARRPRHPSRRPGGCGDTNRVREFLHKNFVPFTWTDCAPVGLPLDSSGKSTQMARLVDVRRRQNPSEPHPPGARQSRRRLARLPESARSTSPSSAQAPPASPPPSTPPAKA